MDPTNILYPPNRFAREEVSRRVDPAVEDIYREMDLADLIPAAVLAADLTPQQRKMKDCDNEANRRDLHGEARQKFMTACLSEKAPEKNATRRKP